MIAPGREIVVNRKSRGRHIMLQSAVSALFLVETLIGLGGSAHQLRERGTTAGEPPDNSGGARRQGIRQLAKAELLTGEPLHFDAMVEGNFGITIGVSFHYFA